METITPIKIKAPPIVADRAAFDECNPPTITNRPKRKKAIITIILSTEVLGVTRDSPTILNASTGATFVAFIIGSNDATTVTTTPTNSPYAIGANDSETPNELIEGVLAAIALTIKLERP